jgi:deoxyribonuclease-4
VKGRLTDKDDLLGCHVSIAGGFDRAVERGAGLGCTALQLFTRNQLRWHSKPIEREQIESFTRSLSGNTRVREVCAHGSYLPNLASPDPEIKRRSIASVKDELERCGLLGISCLIIHPGNHMEEGEKEGIRKVVSSLTEAMKSRDGRVKVLVETTAGQGTGLGYRFEHLRDIVSGVGDAMAGVCFDTCHVFAAGYDLRGEDEYGRTLDQFDRTIGLSHIEAIHLNDSKGDIGSRLDRHQHIGEGKIGIDAFKRVMRDERFAEVPKIIETPKRMNGADMDVRNLEILRTLAVG